MAKDSEGVSGTPNNFKCLNCNRVEILIINSQLLWFSVVLYVGMRHFINEAAWNFYVDFDAVYGIAI